MSKFIVLHRINNLMSAFNDPLGFECEAINASDAELQCNAEYPESDVLWVYQKKESDNHNAYNFAVDEFYSKIMNNFAACLH